jgi:hypothetical protein
LSNQWKEYILVTVHKKGDKTYCNNYSGISLLSTYKILSNILLSRLSPYKTIGNHQCGFDVTDQLLIRFSTFIRYWRKNGSTVGQCMDFKKAYDSERREVLYNILIEFGVRVKLVRLTEICLS